MNTKTPIPVPTSNPKTVSTTETISVVKNIRLDGLTLKADRITTTYQVKRELHPKTNEPFRTLCKKVLNETVDPMSFALAEVTYEKLTEYRMSGIPSFMLKLDGKFYYTRIPNDINFITANILGAHQCAVVKHECSHLTAASDEEGGCAKVRDRSHCIERYPWITRGYETFNTKHDVFVVVNCLHYEKCPPRKKLTTEEVNRLKLSIAQYVWDDVTTLGEVRMRKHMRR